MKTLLSKTNFLEFLMCPKNTWLKLHKPELLKLFSLSPFELQLVEQGNEVETYARNLFPGGVQIVETGDDAVQETERLMLSKVPTIFQATFVVDGYIAKVDALEYDKKTDCWNICEIKGTNSIKENGGDRDHIDDLAFQASVLRRAKVSVGKYFLVYLNKEYARIGDLVVEEMFKKEDVTEKITDRLVEVEPKMEAALEFLSQENEPGIGCDCHLAGRSAHCSTFKYSHPKVPDYSIHDLARIGNSKKKLIAMVERETYAIEDIPDDITLSAIQTNQVQVHITQKPIIEIENIREELSQLAFPLYFLDYETFAPAIPMFTGYSPYQRIPFQFSLHILKDASSEPEHIEYLHEEASDPSERVVELLTQHIQPGGTVISWNKSFEQGVNKELAARHPKHQTALERINSDMYDLQDIFKKQHYVHPDFCGKTSIKKVLPALVSGAQHADLSIQDGGQASDAWWKMILPITSDTERAQISQDLKEYCKLDTYAMFQIWKHLYDLYS
ncbi:MAG: DUF2779 domain-containing protein [Candidatus Paceibacterota bacterium]